MRAISARAYLSTMAGSPRCMKFPPMTIEKPVRSGELPGSGEVIGVALVEGVVFGDDTGDFHELLLLIKNSLSQYNRFRKNLYMGKYGEKEHSSDKCIQKDTYLQLKIGECSDIINYDMWLEKKAFYYLRKESRIMGFIDVIKERAKANKKTIVLPETEDRRTYEAAAQILKEGIANIILVGSEEAVKKGSEGLDISRCSCR